MQPLLQVAKCIARSSELCGVGHPSLWNNADEFENRIGDATYMDTSAFRTLPFSVICEALLSAEVPHFLLCNVPVELKGTSLIELVLETYL